jgi:hypothetical protein
VAEAIFRVFSRLQLFHCLSANCAVVAVIFVAHGLAFINDELQLQPLGDVINDAGAHWNFLVAGRAIRSKALVGELFYYVFQGHSELKQHADANTELIEQSIERLSLFFSMREQFSGSAVLK